MSSNTPRILVIIGSPRKYGSCLKLASIAERGVKDAGGIPERVFLYDYNIKPCIGCVSDDQYVCRFPCIIEDDDFNKLGEKMLETDGYIFVSPIYWYSVSGLWKNFIDRMTSFENMIHHTGRSLLEGKVAGFIVVGNDSGGIHAIATLMVTMNSYGIHIPPWALAYSHEREDVLNDQQAVMDAYNVGYIVAKAARILKGDVVWYNPRVDIDDLRQYAYKESLNYNSYKLERLELFKKKKV